VVFEWKDGESTGQRRFISKRIDSTV